MTKAQQADAAIIAKVMTEQLQTSPLQALAEIACLYRAIGALAHRTRRFKATSPRGKEYWDAYTAIGNKAADLTCLIRTHMAGDLGAGDMLTQLPGLYQAIGATAERMLKCKSASTKRGSHYWQTYNILTKKAADLYVALQDRLTQIPS